MPIENVIRILVFIKRNIKSKPVIEYINDSIRELKQFQNDDVEEGFRYEQHLEELTNAD